MGKLDEVIVVVSRDNLFEKETLAFQGIERDKGRIETLETNMDRFMTTYRRGDAEEDKKFKQPISYVVFRKEDKLFVSERLKAGGEDRLHHQVSVGFGGHMNMIGEGFYDVLKKNTDKELEEELKVENQEEMDLKVVGIINDDLTDVGKHHIGFVYQVELDKEAHVEIRETHKLKGTWVDVDTLKKGEWNERLEDWAKMVVEEL